jgi:hypothetical protein
MLAAIAEPVRLAPAGSVMGSRTARPRAASAAAPWQTGAPSATFPPPPATTVACDFVKSLVDALNARGPRYAPVAVTSNVTVQAPGLFPFGFMNVRLAGRVAILGRADVPLTLTNVQTANFSHNTALQSGGLHRDGVDAAGDRGAG